MDRLHERGVERIRRSAALRAERLGALPEAQQLEHAPQQSKHEHECGLCVRDGHGARAHVHEQPEERRGRWCVHADAELVDVQECGGPCEDRLQCVEEEDAVRKAGSRHGEARGSTCGGLKDAIPSDELRRHAAMSAELGGGQVHTAHLH